ncbi:hypothetical protein CCR75_000771 [Bremia lactucae]|uniref:Vms1-associating treble clef domain-containing protein n=1 Tax=Bremia lactucae TaxID=4779 RepID=A0A976II05_BRELC|nr:hypothetical protein CCR75_000771 [Bremia lactucae]
MIRSIQELVHPEDVEIALPHEHVLHNIGASVAASSLTAKHTICFEDLIKYRQFPFAYGGCNLLLQKEDEAFRELEMLQRVAKKSFKVLVLDVTLPVEGRDTFIKERLNLTTRLQNVQLLTVTTFENERMNEINDLDLDPMEQSERIAKTIEAELLFGIKSGGFVAFPGAVYQQICVNSTTVTARERVLVHGLARVCTNYSFDENSTENVELETMIRSYIDALINAGAEKKKLVVCHADRWCYRESNGKVSSFLLEVFDRGVSVLFDTIGLIAVSDVMLINSYSPSSAELPGTNSQEPPSHRCIARTIANIIKINPQYCHQLLLSTNVHQRIQYRRYGGGGYTYLFKYFKTYVLGQGVSAAQWDQIVRGNVVKLWAWYVPPEVPPIPKNYLQCSICEKHFEPIEGEYFSKFTFIYCGTKCLRRHSRQNFVSLH